MELPGVPVGHAITHALCDSSVLHQYENCDPTDYFDKIVPATDLNSETVLLLAFCLFTLCCIGLREASYAEERS